MSDLISRLLLLGFAALLVPAGSALAVTIDGVDGVIGAGEYEWNTDGPEGSGKWYTRGSSQEYNDGSGGNPWDINFLGTGTDKHGNLKIGAVGGSILSGQNPYRDTTLTLSDFAINVVAGGERPTDPTSSPSGWDYALRLLSIDSSGDALFDLFSLTDDNDKVVGSWKGSGKGQDSTNYDHQPYSYGSTETFKMVDGHLVKGDIAGKYTPNTPGSDDGVLEVSFDLGLLGLFDESTGGKVITYLTMSCANDEAIVHADISAVPVPAAFWLFGTALIGFIGISRRTRM